MQANVRISHTPRYPLGMECSGTSAMTIIKIRERAQITLPAEVLCVRAPQGR